ncbi:diguanylate phosphodiesterase [Hydrogenispora ethanolica]|uniref:Diguanylate phosphodiesterase n=2 Tax=Hydrogenispora ethanolica TaxID=1082276 RepID=A0A4R1R8L2_HYDET|nr:diguanylate phosphodiesterase [Hydrogenispora ethanolica]
MKFITEIRGIGSMDVFVARQPIFDRQLKVYGYELLFRSGLENFYTATDGDQATSTVIANSFLLIGIDSLVGKKRAFINFTRNLLLNETATILPKETAFIEILENVTPDPETIAACQRLKQLGYSLAMDDFVFKQEMTPLIELADLIKVDFLTTSVAERRDLVRRFCSKPLKFLAEKVESRAEFEEALDMGYAYFQGFFLSKPVIIAGKDVPGYKVNYLRVLHELGQSSPDFDRVESLIKQDISLTYKLLKFINSAAFGFRTRIQSVRQAVVLLGLKEAIKWLSLIAIRGLASDHPDELVVSSVFRARFAELLGPAVGLESRCSELFLMGLFSMIDVFLGRPMADILDELPITEEVKGALLGKAGVYGNVLQLVQAYEKGDWEQVLFRTDALRIRDAQLPELFQDALEQTKVFTAISAAHA